MCDGEQGDAGILGSLENFSLYVDAHSAGTLIQQGIFRSNAHRGQQRLCISMCIYKNEQISYNDLSVSLSMAVGCLK